jgi:hypothetical protein
MTYQAMIIYINMTNGIQALVDFIGEDVRFTRLQSTLLEQGHHEKFFF